MSDYEKEKLKEFLRNKRPKRSLNSSNESNNSSNENSKFDDKFKNSNNLNSKSELNSLNLKEDSNLEKQDFKENSNLNNKNNTSNFKNPNSHNQNNTQISDNKNSNKRDYDEEPIVILNKARFISFLFIVYSLTFMCLFALIFNVEINFQNWSGQGAIAGLVYSIKEFIIAKKQKIKFTNTRIEILENENIIQTIEISSIFKVFCNYSNVYNIENKIPISKELIFLSILLLGICILYFRGFGTFAMLILAPTLAYFAPRIAYFGKMNLRYLVP